MESVAFTTAKRIAERLEVELEHARRYWAVFGQANGVDESHRADLREAVANTHAAHAYEYIRMSSAICTVLALARITDPPQGDRNSLSALRGVVGPIEVQEEISNDALTWYEGLTFGGRTSAMALSARDEVASRLKIFISEVGTLIRSEEVVRIRKLRNEALAHALTLSSIFPTYEDIEAVFRAVSEFVATANLLVRGRHFDAGSFDKVSLTYAEEFWDVFEHGAKDMKTKRLI